MNPQTEPTPDESAAAVEAFLAARDDYRASLRDGAPSAISDVISAAIHTANIEVHQGATSFELDTTELREGHLRALLGDRFAMLDLITEFIAIDGRECDVDHAGDCRPHGYPTVEAGAPCPYQQARDLLAANKDALDARQRRRSTQARAQLESMLDSVERARRR